MSNRSLFPCIGVLLLCIGIPAHSQSSKGGSKVENVRSSEGVPAVYQQWLDQDVRWIITAKEVALFSQLKTNGDRDRFIEQFWLRRDPKEARQESKAAGPAKNVFKREHYRRLAYANLHFAEAVPGWKTDRGRVYIVYGPPVEEKVGSADGNGAAHRSLIWHYRTMRPMSGEYDVKFEDTCDCGTYLLDASQVRLLFK